MTETTTAPEMQPVKSTQISAIGYNAEAQTMDVQFKKWDGSPNGLYRYRDVPKSKFDAMMAAESVGRYFAAHIKSDPGHPYTRLS